MQPIPTHDEDQGVPTPTGGREPILAVEHLRVEFALDEGTVRAVNDVSLEVAPNSTLGVVGESGCGKSVMARAILQVVGGTGRIVGGNVWYSGGPGAESIDLAAQAPNGQVIKGVRGNDVAMVFQEPMAAFSPIYTIGRQIVEGIRVHSDMSKKAARARTVELLGRVGIPQPSRAVDRYPFELSGGMRQRAMIAMALSCDPAVLIADEPTTALDVTIQAQILGLLKEIQEETGMAIVIISHNMGVIAEMADTVAVMYLGRVVEEGTLWDIFDNPSHPYTEALLKSMPMVGTEVSDRLESITGSVPNPYALPSGCHFHPRCGYAIPGTCEVTDPGLYRVSDGHRAACVLVKGAEDDE